MAGEPVNEYAEQQAQMQQAYAAVLGKVTELLGHTPMQPLQLIEALVEAKWPSDAHLRAGDFWVLTTPGVLPWVQPFPVYKDNTGPYFYVSRTKVRPQTGKEFEHDLDLTEWSPPEERLIQPAAFSSVNAERAARRGK